MGLKPLEFSECLLDSPYFRESIHDHEKELDQANDAIKSLIKECRNLIKALENLKNAQSSFTTMLNNFKLRTIGEVDTEDELEYEDAFPELASIVQKVEEERERMLEHANIQLIEPLERFRKEQIGRAKEEKKKFDRETERVCGLLESHLKASPKKRENALQEADAQLEHELRNFREMSLDYVTKLQEVNEKKKFELVEIILSYMLGQATFYHNGHEVFQDHKNYLRDLQIKLQTTRDRYDITKDAADDLKNKTKKKFNNGELHKGKYAREGYLLVYDKRKSVLSAQWVKHYCMYTKENKILTMLPYTQTNLKMVANTDTFVVTSCIRKITEASDRRFLFDITGQDRTQPITLQSMSEDDRKQWLEVMEGKEPIYVESSELVNQGEGVTKISSVGIQFVTKCMEAVETRGINDQGIYRIAGVSSKFNKLLNTGIDPKQADKLDLVSENSVWDIKTITSAMKQYFRNLSEPIFTFKHHHEFLNAIKLETYNKKIEKLKELTKMLPEENYKILHRLMFHLKLVAQHSNKNLMQESNLGVVLGPTLMRPKEETMAAIMSIKFQSIVIETIIKEYNEIFGEGPPPSYTGSGNNNNNNVPSNSPSTTERTPSAKYRAPGPPARPSVLPKRMSDPDRNGNILQKPVAAERPPISPNSPSKDGNSGIRPQLTKQISAPPIAAKPQRAPFPGARFAVGGGRFGETVTPFTSAGASGESSDTPHRRESYAMAIHKNVKSDHSRTSQPERSPPPTKPTVPPPKIPKRNEWKVRALYDCVAENSAELSFNKDAIISNVRVSTEEGWLIGMLNGKTGLIPENYCEKIT